MDPSPTDDARRRPLRTARLFLALWPNDAVRRALAERRNRCRWPRGAAPVADARLHLTLHFIGAVAVDRLDELATGLRVPMAPFDLDFDRCVAWPHGLVVVEASHPPEALRTLHAALGAALRRLGLPVERRRLRAHVTLARRAEGAVLGDGGMPIRWHADGYALVRSHADATLGYERLWTQAASGAPDALA
jgi:2'-5' RNA ligase